MRLTLSIAIALIVSMTATPSAQACPGGYGIYTCSGGGAANVCTTVGGTVYECDLTRNGDTSRADVSAIYAPAACTAGDDYCVFGVDAAGNNFCCQRTDAAMTKLVVLGGSYADDIDLLYGAYDLDNHGGGGTFDGVVSARGGADVIQGSRVTAVNYKDFLRGDAGADFIYGNAGNDDIQGDADNDYIDGGAGNDVIRGGDGHDDILGKAGNDDIQGNNDNDEISGGDGDDILHGDDHDDLVCGDNGNDSMTGDGGDDLLWGDAAGDTKNGGVHVLGDECDSAGANSACEVVTAGMARPCTIGP